MVGFTRCLFCQGCVDSRIFRIVVICGFLIWIIHATVNEQVTEYAHGMILQYYDKANGKVRLGWTESSNRSINDTSVAAGRYGLSERKSEIHLGSFEVAHTESYLSTTIRYDIVPFRRPQRLVTSFSCAKILAGDYTEIMAARTNGRKHPRSHLSPQATVDTLSNCNLTSRGYRLEAASVDEKEFPIAFSIIMHTQVEQTERLLKLIYRPQNIYCIHVDSKASDLVKAGVYALAACFDNVFIASKLAKVVYSGFGRVQADLNCMSDLLKNSVQWKYYINLPNEVFPLKTNEELVSILQVFNGTNDIEGLPALPLRYEYRYEVRNGYSGTQTMVKTNKKKAPPPHLITIVKGSAYGSFSRAFVEYVLTNHIAKDFIQWSRDTLTPDEHIWATLHHTAINPHLNTPGGYAGPLWKKHWISAYAHWCGTIKCGSGLCIHGICIQGLPNVYLLLDKPHLFANKFKLGTDDLAWDCMEEWFLNRTFTPRTRGDLDQDLDYYRQLGHVKYRLP